MLLQDHRLELVHGMLRRQQISKSVTVPDRTYEWNKSDLYVVGNRPAATLAEQERQDLAKAMAISQSMGAGRLSADQENGIIDSSQPQFGPATREHYDTAKWTMTLPGAHAREVLENPDPPDRKRGSDAPAFLKTSLSEVRIPSLITILHAIPLAREALLSLEYTVPDYGIDPEWWDGVPITARTVPAAYSSLNKSQSSHQELLYELQRLMAFLDISERAYASADSLVHLVTATKDYKTDSSLSAVLEAWATAASEGDPENDLANTFRSTAWHVDPDIADPEVQTFSCLGLTIPDTSDPGSLPCRTLYDVLDYALWGSLREDSSEYAILYRLGHVISVEVTRQDKLDSGGLGIKIPATWYLDRYLESSREKVSEMLASKRLISREINQLDSKKAKIAEYKPTDSDQRYTASELIEKALKHFADSHINDGWSEEDSLKLISNINQEMVDNLQRVAEIVDQKLTGIAHAEFSLLQR